MKTLIIGGNRFVGLRLSHLLDKDKKVDLSIVNRTGQVAHAKNATIYKADRDNLELSHLDRDWDVVYDFAAYTLGHAQSSLDYFHKVKRYIFISTASVYNAGADLRESSFDPLQWKPEAIPGTHPAEKYQFGKRQAEAAFLQSAKFPTVCVRFPVILGPDDYTERLEFHIRHTRKGQPIYATNPEARFSMVHAEDAAAFLLWAGTKTFTGPINVASRDPLSLKTLCAQIELILEQRPRVQKPPPQGVDEADFSPYSPPNDWFLNTDRLRQEGFTPRPTQEWLPELIGLPESSSGPVH